MAYNSFAFLAFSAAVLVLYYLIGRKRQKYVLLLANLAFFLLSGPKYLPFIAGAALISWLGGLMMGKEWKREAEALSAAADMAQKKEIRAAAKKRARRWMLAALLVVLAALVVCKYTNFVETNINRVLGHFGLKKLEMLNLILPIGISFYTFMAVSYILDIYWKRYEAETNFIDFAAYLAWFPHVVQGPIDRYNHFKAQVKDGIAFDSRNLIRGAELTLWGFFKKLVIADRLAMFVNTVYDGWEGYQGLIFVIATVLYSVQIYADFSGCIDIVSGVSEMFGIKLSPNFHHPYFSKTMPEFWRRWHMSLMEWFKDYIYYPVSTSGPVKNLKKKLKKAGKTRASELFASCFPAFVVWLTTGIWHGASWTFVLWGMFHALLIILGNCLGEPLAKLTQKLKINTETFSWRLWQMARTFFLCCVGRVFFRASSIAAAFGILKQSLQGPHWEHIWTGKLYTYGMDRDNFAVALLAIAVLWIVDILGERMDVREELGKQNLLFRWLVVILGVMIVLVFGIYGPTFNAANFIYGQF